MPDDTATPLSGEPAKPRLSPGVPLSPGVKAAVMLLVTMGLVLVAGVIFVLVVVVKRASHPAESAAAFAGRFGVSDIHVAPGDTVKSVSLADDRIVIHLSGDSDEEIVVVSAKTGQELGRIRLKPLRDLAARDVR